MLAIKGLVNTIPFSGKYSRIRRAFSVVTDKGAFWNALRRAGYTHYIKVARTETAEELELPATECAYLLFRGAPPLLFRNVRTIRIFEIRRFPHPSSKEHTHTVAYRADLTPRELKTWLQHEDLKDTGTGVLNELPECRFALAS